MEFLTAIKEQIPDYAKDIRLNLDGAIARSSLVRASGDLKRSPTGSKVKGSPYHASCASTIEEPQPARPQSL